MDIGTTGESLPYAWNDRDYALLNGPICAFKVWQRTCGVKAYVEVSNDEFCM